jgi:hypothetical protein
MSPVHGSIVPSDRFSSGGVGGNEKGFEGEDSSNPERNWGSWDLEKDDL